MKQSLRNFLYVVLATVLASCAQLSPKTFNEKTAAAYTLVSSVRSVNLSLSQAEKISVEEVKNIQEQCNHFRTAIDIARQVHSADPATADKKIDATIQALKGLEVYLRSKS